MNNAMRLAPASRVGAQLSGRVGPGATAMHTVYGLPPQVVVQAAEWRFLVRMLYVGAGSPQVPGFTASQVDQILWGELPADAEFLSAMLRVLSATTAPTASVPPDHRGKDEDDEPAADVDAFRKILEQRRADAAARARAEVAQFWKQPQAQEALEAERARARGFTPPNPELVGTVEEFIEALRKLRRWAGLSLRDLAERSEKQAKKGENGSTIELPRATVSDLENRRKLPKVAALRAYVVACGLPPVEQERWLRTRGRLALPQSPKSIKAESSRAASWVDLDDDLIMPGPHTGRVPAVTDDPLF